MKYFLGVQLLVEWLIINNLLIILEVFLTIIQAIQTSLFMFLLLDGESQTNNLIGLLEIHGVNTGVKMVISRF